nr:NUDIX hydrolase N-terminal domain-containing protein [Streptococcus suis]
MEWAVRLQALAQTGL